MKKFVALSALALVAAAGTANAQTFRLDLSLVARTVVGSAGDPVTKTDFQTGGIINSAVAVTYEIEIRYRINDSGSDTLGSRGLLGAQIHVGFTGGGSYSLGTASLSNFQFDKPGSSHFNSEAALNPDDTDVVDGGDPINNGYFTGLHGPFRDGLNGVDQDPGNAGDGITSGAFISPAGFDFVPLALSAPGQNSWGAGTNPSTSNTNTNATTWGLFSFVITVTSGTVNITADAVADPGTGVAFTHYRKQGATSPSDPTESTLHTAGTQQINVVPTPASATLLGLGGLLVARRRRA